MWVGRSNGTPEFPRPSGRRLTRLRSRVPARKTAQVSIRKIWLEAFKSGAVPTLTRAGFVKERTSSFARRAGSASQYLSFGASRGNSPDQGTWLLDVGWDLDETVSLDRSNGAIRG